MDRPNNIIPPFRKPHKFRAIRTVVDGVLFDSKGEARRFQDLKLLEKAGQISDLKLKPAYPIDVNGQRVCIVVPDFQYIDARTGKLITEDFKSEATITREYLLKKKLLAACHGIHIIEVFR